jgi:hypothetical protein
MSRGLGGMRALWPALRTIVALDHGGWALGLEDDAPTFGTLGEAIDYYHHHQKALDSIADTRTLNLRNIRCIRRPGACIRRPRNGRIKKEVPASRASKRGPKKTG